MREDDSLMKRWTFDTIPDQSGRTAIVTGANTGIGFETARMLAAKGARVIIACRNLAKGETALSRIRSTHSGVNIDLALLDLGDLASVAAFAEGIHKTHTRLDLLINNAGVMIPPFTRTKQQFELQFGTNHLGHFALSGRLFPLLERTTGSRLVTVSSTAAYTGRIDFDDLDYRRRPYRAWAAYSQSKLANLLFMLELGRRLSASSASVMATAAHPGWTATELQRNTLPARLLNPLFAMKPADGALPTLRAAVDPSARNGAYFGPGGPLELSGPPARARLPGRALDSGVAQKLWIQSEELTGVAFPLPASPALRQAG
jgi:NAD(P)-dependent dehydrogenase (short-subunit alcohol dehydrogenase family)